MPNQWLLLLLSVVHLVPAGAATAPGLTPQPPGVVSARGGLTKRGTYEATTCRYCALVQAKASYATGRRSS